MTRDILLYVGSFVIFLWGIAHIIPTKSVAGGFEPLSEENKRMLIMEWVAGGLTPCYIGVLVFGVTFFGDPSGTTAAIVYWISTLMLGTQQLAPELRLSL